MTKSQNNNTPKDANKNPPPPPPPPPKQPSIIAQESFDQINTSRTNTNGNKSKQKP